MKRYAMNGSYTETKDYADKTLEERQAEWDAMARRVDGNLSGTIIRSPIEVIMPPRPTK